MTIDIIQSSMDTIYNKHSLHNIPNRALRQLKGAVFTGNWKVLLVSLSVYREYPLLFARAMVSVEQYASINESESSVLTTRNKQHKGSIVPPIS